MGDSGKILGLTEPLKKLVNNDGKNSFNLVCPREPCKCIILKRDTATLVEMDSSKRPMLDEKDLNDETKHLREETHFWRLHDMMLFENVGFSHSVGSLKYLTCADCEKGPIGYHDTAANPKEYFVSCSSVKPASAAQN